MNTREELQQMLDKLATQRDEVILKAHLAKLEAQSEWRELEGKLDQLRGKAAQAADLAGDSGKDILAAARVVAEEIGKGYDRLRRLF
jgi:SMC interacting uncharacterized protein involved in chromosome segregation